MKRLGWRNIVFWMQESDYDSGYEEIWKRTNQEQSGCVSRCFDIRIWYQNPQWGGGHPLPKPKSHPLGAFGASILPPVQWQIFLILCPAGAPIRILFPWVTMAYHMRLCSLLRNTVIHSLSPLVAWKPHQCTRAWRHRLKAKRRNMFIRNQCSIWLKRHHHHNHLFKQNEQKYKQSKSV